MLSHARNTFSMLTSRHAPSPEQLTVAPLPTSLLGYSFLFIPFSFLDPKRKEKTGFSFRLEDFLLIPGKRTSSDLERKGSKIRQTMKEFLEKRLDQQWASRIKLYYI